MFRIMGLCHILIITLIYLIKLTSYRSMNHQLLLRVPYKFFSRIFGHHEYFCLMVSNIISLWWIITLTIYGIFLSNKNRRSRKHLSDSKIQWRIHTMSGLGRFTQTMDVNILHSHPSLRIKASLTIVLDLTLRSIMECLKDDIVISWKDVYFSYLIHPCMLTTRIMPLPQQFTSLPHQQDAYTEIEYAFSTIQAVQSNAQLL